MAEYMPFSRLQEIFDAARHLRVGVIGDFTLAGYWQADMTRSALSRETPLYPHPVVREHYACGGAANVAWNLAALGLAEVRSFTMLGDDWRGGLLLSALQAVGINGQDVLVDPGWFTPFFGKIMLSTGDSQQEDAHLDFVNTSELSVQSEEDLLSRLESRLPDLDAVVVADYLAQGVITAAVLEGLNRMAASAGRVVFTVNSRERIGQFTDMIRKPDAAEAARWLFPDRSPDLVGVADFVEAALYPQVDCGCPLFITLGADGCLVMTGGESHRVPALSAANTTGSGNVFLSALTAALAAGSEPVEAAFFGQLAAAAALRKPGITGAALTEEMLAINRA